MFSIPSQLSSLRIRIPVVLTAIFLCFSAAGVRAQSGETVVASVNGRPILIHEVDYSIAAQIYPLQQQLYALRKSALENLILSKLLDDAARERGITVDSLRKLFTAGEVAISAAQVEESFTANASYFASMSPDEARERLRLDLESKDRMKHYRTALQELRKNAKILVTLKAPDSTLTGKESPVRGSADPVVTIVEFSDFECPYCREVQPDLKQILKMYGESVKLVFKHLPLEGHRHSLLAASSAYCAGEQGKFWEFHDALFDAKTLSVDEINRLTTTLKLDSPALQTCLSSDRVKAAIARDRYAAQQFRIDGTPGFVINGKVHRGALSLAALQQLVESELNPGQRSTSSSSNQEMQ